MEFNFTKEDRYSELPLELRKYMKIFSKNRLKSFLELEQFVAEDNFKSICAFCHNQIGVAGSYKCYKLEEITLFIQVHARGQEIKPIREIMSLFKTYLDELEIDANNL